MTDTELYDQLTPFWHRTGPGSTRDGTFVADTELRLNVDGDTLELLKEITEAYRGRIGAPQNTVARLALSRGLHSLAADLNLHITPTG